MKKVVIIIIFLLAVFSILRAYSTEAESQLNIYPGSLEFSDKDSELSIGFGLIESAEKKNLIWNIFPVKIAITEGKKKFYLAFNGLSFLTASGINIGKDVKITGVQTTDVICFGGTVTISGKVEGDVWAFGTDITLDGKAEVLGEVVALGGIIIQDKKSLIRGNKYSLPELKIPFIGLLSSSNSIQTIRFFLELFHIALFLIILFLLLFFKQPSLTSQSLSLFSKWKGALVYFIIAMVVVPVFFMFLVVTVVGIVVIPVFILFIMLISYYGFSCVAIRMGKLFLKKEGGSTGHFFLCGLFGLLLLRGPALVGILLTLLNADILVIIGNLLAGISSIALTLAYLYGFGVTLVNMRARPVEAGF